MTKRISCKVVRSVPLGKNSGYPGNCYFARTRNAAHYVSEDSYSAITVKTASEPAFSIDVKGNCDSVTYTNRLEVTSLSADDSSAGLNLNCLA